MNLTVKAIKWMLKKYNGQPVQKNHVKILVAAYKAGHREAKKKPTKERG